MTSSKWRSFLKQFSTCVLIAVVTSLFIGFTIALIGKISSSATEIVLIGALLAIPAFTFVAFGIFSIGVPVLLIARRVGYTRDIRSLFAVGVMTGAVAAPALYTIPFGVGVEGLVPLTAIGAVSGLIAATFWWHIIEKQISVEQTNV